jgi:hypothetical protein
MNPDSVESDLEIKPISAYTLTWDDENRTLRIDFTSPLNYETNYTLTISEDY